MILSEQYLSLNSLCDKIVYFGHQWLRVAGYELEKEFNDNLY